jgi:signal transduction histidine kinase
VSSSEGSIEASSPPVGFDPFELSRLRNELRLLRFLNDISNRLRETRDAEAALRFIVRACREHFDASAACFAVAQPPGQRAELLFNLPSDHVWDLPSFADAIRGSKPPVDPRLMFARIRRRERPWGLLALARPAVEFDKSERQALVRIGVTVSALLREFDLLRIREVRDRIDRKIMEELRPIDLSYQILDALRSLTRYDHSSAVLMNDGTNGALELVAEQIAWRKGKSERIGSRFAMSPQIHQWLGENVVYGFTRNAAGSWQEWDGRPMQALVDLLDYNGGATGEAESEILCAPLRGKEGVLGLLKVSARHAGTFGAYEAELMSAFLPQASIAVHNAQRAETLQAKMIAAERKHAMADLARGVSHDLNNALGSVLPLVQQLCEEASDGKLDSKTCSEDLKQIERSLHTCRRIFSGMLTFARRAATTIGNGHVRQAVDCTLAILEEGMLRRGVAIQIDVPDALPTIAGAQSDLEQLLLNLLSNARDSMPDGGRLHVVAHGEGDMLRLIVRDTGCGIAPEILPRITEPFFTTKPNGSGLGLSICRSIVWDMHGELRFDTTPGEGTAVSVLLPVSPIA